MALYCVVRLAVTERRRQSQLPFLPRELYNMKLTAALTVLSPLGRLARVVDGDSFGLARLYVIVGGQEESGGADLGCRLSLRARFLCRHLDKGLINGNG